MIPLCADADAKTHLPVNSQPQSIAFEVVNGNSDALQEAVGLRVIVASRWGGGSKIA